MRKAFGLLFVCVFFASAHAANAYVQNISETEQLICPDTIQGYKPNGDGTYTFLQPDAAKGTVGTAKKNTDSTIVMQPNGCARVTVTRVLGPDQCGTMTLQLSGGQMMQRSACDTDPKVPYTPVTDKDAPKVDETRTTGYTGPRVDKDVIEQLIAALPPQKREDCTKPSAGFRTPAIGCTSGNPMNVGTFHGKVRNYKFDKDGYPVDGIAAGVNLIRQWCQNEGRCSITTIMLKYAPYDPKHPGNDPVAAAKTIASFIKMNPNERFNHHDPTTMAKLALGFVLNENGRYHYGAESIKRGTELSFQLWPPGAAPKNVGEIIPYTVTSGPTNTNNGNSFIDNLGSNIRAFTPLTNAVAAPLMQGITQPQTTTQTPTGTSPSISTQPITIPSTPVAAQPAPAAQMLLVQPKSVRRGGVIYVSWTSVHMSESNRCIVTDDSSKLIATANEGTRTITASTGGVQVFTLKCADSAGRMYISTDQVLVE